MASRPLIWACYLGALLLGFALGWHVAERPRGIVSSIRILECK